MINQETLARLAGLETERRTLSYHWRDAALYALAVGAGGAPQELCYVYEGDMKTLPTFGVLPYWGTVSVSPRLPRPVAVPVLAEELLQPEASFVNLDYDLICHQPIDPIQGELLYQDKTLGVYDRGEGRGLALRSQAEVRDGAGRLLCTNRCTTLFPTLGGFGGDPMPPWETTIPQRDPDLVIEDQLSPTQHLLYRLTGDTNLVHCDPAVAQSRGLKGPFVHDLCNFGFACRLAIGALLPGQPERVTRIAAQFKGILYPGAPLALHLWKTGVGEGIFRLINRETGKAALDKGLFQWQ